MTPILDGWRYWFRAGHNSQGDDELHESPTRSTLNPPLQTQPRTTTASPTQRSPMERMASANCVDVYDDTDPNRSMRLIGDASKVNPIDNPTVPGVYQQNDRKRRKPQINGSLHPQNSLHSDTQTRRPAHNYSRGKSRCYGSTRATRYSANPNDSDGTEEHEISTIQERPPKRPRIEEPTLSSPINLVDSDSDKAAPEPNAAARRLRSQSASTAQSIIDLSSPSDRNRIKNPMKSLEYNGVQDVMHKNRKSRRNSSHDNAPDASIGAHRNSPTYYSTLQLSLKTNAVPLGSSHAHAWDMAQPRHHVSVLRKRSERQESIEDDEVEEVASIPKPKQQLDHQPSAKPVSRRPRMIDELRREKKERFQNSISNEDESLDELQQDELSMLQQPKRAPANRSRAQRGNADSFGGHLELTEIPANNDDMDLIPSPNDIPRSKFTGLDEALSDPARTLIQTKRSGRRTDRPPWIIVGIRTHGMAQPIEAREMALRYQEAEPCFKLDLNGDPDLLSIVPETSREFKMDNIQAIQPCRGHDDMVAIRGPRTSQEGIMRWLIVFKHREGCDQFKTIIEYGVRRHNTRPISYENFSKEFLQEDRHSLSSAPLAVDHGHEEVLLNRRRLQAVEGIPQPQNAQENPAQASRMRVKGILDSDDRRSRCADPDDLAPKQATQNTSGRRAVSSRSTRASSKFRISPDPGLDAMGSDDEKYSIINGLGPPWSSPVVYPVSGRKRATVDFEDLPRLDNGEFLNDNLIDFGIRWLQEHQNEDQKKNAYQVYFFNTYFFSTLTSSKKRSTTINYDGVQRWTAKEDIFVYDYVVVPINENLHWYLAIICNLQNIEREIIPDDFDEEVREGLDQDGSSEVQLEIGGSDKPSSSTLGTALHSDDAPSGLHEGLESSQKDAEYGTAADFLKGVQQKAPSSKAKAKKRPSGGALRKYNPREPIIIILDSLGGSHPRTTRALKDYVSIEAEKKRNSKVDPNVLSGMTAKNIPLQNNFADCGIFMLEYISKFLENPAEFVRKILQRDMDEIRDWGEVDPVQRRDHLRQLLLKLGKEQEEERQKEKRRKREMKNPTTAISASSSTNPKDVLREIGSEGKDVAKRQPGTVPPMPNSGNRDASELIIPRDDIGPSKAARSMRDRQQLSPSGFVDVGTAFTSTQPIQVPGTPPTHDDEHDLDEYTHGKQLDHVERGDMWNQLRYAAEQDSNSVGEIRQHSEARGTFESLGALSPERDEIGASPVRPSTRGK